MKQIRVRLELDPDELPSFYSTVSESPESSEFHVLDWNLSTDEIGTVLYATDGDADRFREAIEATDGIVDADVRESVRGRSYALIEARLRSISLFSTFMELVGRAGMIVRKPVVIAGNRSYARIVGSPATLQSVVDDVPSNFAVRIDRIEAFPGESDVPERRLSDRQGEVVTTALEMGYYDHPRGTTHAEIAAELDCAPNTVTMHLQKAESKLIPAVFEPSSSNDG